jgi:carbohydrate kinase (thermoresistant glucokinase family)
LERSLQEHRQAARVAVIMGVSGSGKTTIGRALARRLGWLFQEGDALHPPENIAKMKAGHPLDDQDRGPWLAAIAAGIDEWRGRGACGVVTCSALKRRYRDVVIGDRPDVRLVYLEGSRELIGNRISARRGHFMPAGLLDSQFAALEPPAPGEHAIAVSVDMPVASTVARVATALLPRDTKPDHATLTGQWR